MSFNKYMQGYSDPRTLYQLESLLKWKKGEHFSPVLVEISPTHRCNQRCRYCYADKGGERKEILRDDILIKSFSEVADAGANAILVQGTGEPLLHKALPEAIKVGAGKGLSIGISTNGVLLKKELQEKILEHLVYIRFSALDNNSVRYSYLHGCPEKQCDSLNRNIENAVIFREKNNLSLALFATVYVFQDNFCDLYEIVKFYKKIGLDYIVVQEATYTNYSPVGKGKYVSDEYSENEINDLKAKILTLNDSKFEVKIRFPINDETYIVGMNKKVWINHYCQGINFYTIISSDGEVYPCWRMWGKKEYSYGSLYENTFEQIWYSEKQKTIKRYINTTPPVGDECTVCNLTKLNEILYRYKNKSSKWKDFLI